MTGLSFSDTSTKKNEFSSNLFSIFFHLCFSIFSHPLYFSYFIFFSPYLLRLLSFLSPLFITTTLLLVALLTFTPNNLAQEKCGSELSESKWGLLLSVLQSFLAWLHSKADEIDEEMGFLGEVEAYLVMFQASIFEVFEPKSVEDCSEGFEEAVDAEFSVEGREDSCPMEDPKPKPSVNLDQNLLSQRGHPMLESSPEELPTFSTRQCPKQDCLEREIPVGNQINLDESLVEKVDKVEATRPIEEVKSLESLFQENEELEDLSCEKEQKEVRPLIAELNKVEESKEKWPLRSGSKVMGNRDIYTNKVSTNNNSDGGFPFGASGRVKSLSQRLEANIGSPESNWVYSGKGSNLGSFGSMRVEKEWRRTLACKLFEERHNNADGSEGMDMLWEAYETDSNKVLQKSNTKKGKKSEVENSEDEEEEEEDIEGKLCCLQALKFSAGKMSLGMGRPNLLKFSKALKGIGWLHHVGKHGKKSNH